MRPNAIILGVALVAFSTSRTRAQLATWHGSDQDGGNFGNRVANLGDVDGDGIDDLGVSEPGYTTGSPSLRVGRVAVYSGGSFALIRTHEGTQDLERFGHRIARVGDVNSDGCSDYAVSAPFHDTSTPDSGMVVLYSGKTGSALWSVFGQGDELGNQLTGTGDVDADGIPDTLATTFPTASAILYDRLGNVIDAVVGGSPDFGSSAARLSDVDRDGVDDFAIGESGYSDAAVGFECGIVWIYSGASRTLLYSVLGFAGSDGLGDIVTEIGDVDGDGWREILACGKYSNGNGTASGLIVVASGKDGSTIKKTYGDTANCELGASAAELGDLNHDGVPDYLVGATQDSSDSSQLGLVRIYSGRDHSALYEIAGSSLPGMYTYKVFGQSVAMGDFNGDGISDFVVGDPHYYAYASRGHPGGVIGSADLYYGCPAYWENYGAGWPGNLGVPTFTSRDDPGVGQDVTLDVSNSAGTATHGFVVLGFSDASILTSAGGTLLVSPALWIPLPIPVAGATLAGTIPDDPALYFFDVYLQALEADSHASAGISFTAGLHLRFGIDLP